MEHETPRTATPEQIAGRTLGQLREERGWSQAEVAMHMTAYGYTWHQTTVGRIESGRRPLRLNEVVHVAALFGVSPIQLIVPNTTPARLAADIEASEKGRELVHQQLADATVKAQAASALHSDAEKHYQRLLREAERVDMHLAALHDLEDMIAMQDADA